MDNFLDSVTRKGKKVKERLRGKKGKRDKAGANSAEESIRSSSSFLRPVPHVVAGGHDGEGSRASTDTQQVHSRDRSPQPEPVPVGGREDDGEGKEADVGEKVVGQSHSFLGSNVGTVVGGGTGSTEVGPSTPVLDDGKSGSTWMRLFHLLYLIIPSDNAELSVAPDQVPVVIGPAECAEPGPAASEEKFNWRSTAVATAKLLLYGVRDSADAFGPLKSVAGGLCFVLENCEVLPSSSCATNSTYRYPSE